jgi:hypothetical protein
MIRSILSVEIIKYLNKNEHRLARMLENVGLLLYNFQLTL